MKKQNLTIVGAGSTYTIGMIMSLIAEKETFPLKKITFYDTDAERQALNAEATKILLKERYPEVEEFHYTTNKEEAFKDSDFFFIQIRSGGLQMRERDEQIPLAHGCVGQETCGPGGMAYGLRSIGDMIEIINDIRKQCPDAWILNYTNQQRSLLRLSTVSSRLIRRSLISVICLRLSWSAMRKSLAARSGIWFLSTSGSPLRLVYRH